MWSGVDKRKKTTVVYKSDQTRLTFDLLSSVHMTFDFMHLTVDLMHMTFDLVSVIFDLVFRPT